VPRAASARLVGSPRLLYALLAPDVQAHPSKYLARPKVGLVHRWLDAKGGAYVGVLKFLEEMHLPVDCIAARVRVLSLESAPGLAKYPSDSGRNDEAIAFDKAHLTARLRPVGSIAQ
jgi:hypothetical protein